MENVVIKVGGMSCQGCVKNVTGALSATPGVGSVVVSLEQGERGQDRCAADAEFPGEAEARQAIAGPGAFWRSARSMRPMRASPARR